MSGIQNLSQENQGICKILHRHFNSLRQRQKQGFENSTLTEDIRFAIGFIKSSVNNPIVVLRALGIILTRAFVAFHLSLLQSGLCISSKAMALNQLKRDGWKEADDAYKQHLSSLVGDHEVKNWSILKIPEDSAKCFLDGELFATGVNINGQNQEIMSSTNRPQAEQVFPLVVVEYERVYEDRVVVSLYPRKLELFHAEPLELGGPL